MKILLLACGVVVSTSAFAFELADPEGLIREAIVSLGDQRQDCLDLNGTWQTQCKVNITSEGEQSETQMVTKTVQVQQTGCSRLKVTGEPEIEIGVATTKSHASPLGFRAEQQGIYWDENGSVLKIKMEIGGMRYGEEIYSQVEMSSEIRKTGENTAKQTVEFEMEKSSENEAEENETFINYDCDLTLMR